MIPGQITSPSEDVWFQPTAVPVPCCRPDWQYADRKSKVNASKFGGEGEEIDEFEIDEREQPPPLAEPLVDYRGVALAGGKPNRTTISCTK
jgi:hypothetical protein